MAWQADRPKWTTLMASRCKNDCVWLCLENSGLAIPVLALPYQKSSIKFEKNIPVLGNFIPVLDFC